MPYRGDKLVDLGPPLGRGIHRFARRAVEEVGGDLRKRVRRHTPISRPSAAEIASYGSAAAWRRERGRLPATLWKSWQVGEVVVARRPDSARYIVPVYTLDPVAPHVEWDTQPHIILPKHGKMLMIPTVDGLVFARMVHHPGTKGAHMMATALAEIAATWQTTVREEWAAEARRIWTTRTA